MHQLPATRLAGRWIRAFPNNQINGEEMPGRKFFRIVRPYLSALSVIAVAGMLVFTIYFTELSLQWTTFLAGILVAAILAEATRVSKAEWIVMRRTAQLSAMKDRLERETVLRKTAEDKITADKERLHLLDDVLSTMIVLADTNGYCRYHNHAFRKWLQLRPEQINGHHLKEVIGAVAYGEIEFNFKKSLQGKTVRYDRTQTMADGAVYHLSCEHAPQYNEDGKSTGVYIISYDITDLGDVQSSENADEISQENGNQDMFIDSLFAQIRGENNSAAEAGRVVAALENSAFSLFYQLITPVAADSGNVKHYEILIRLLEEEENMLPPGAFFPMAEKRGLMPHLDRWVVRNVLQLAAGPKSKQLLDDGSIFFLNLAKSTIRDPEFPEFVRQMLEEHGLDGSLLCFEVPNTELAAAKTETAKFIQTIRTHGCRVALDGFGRDDAMFNQIRGFQVEFLKIDSSIILNIHRDPVELAKVAAINRVAKKIGVRTIAEFVENDETMDKLRKIGVDFAQGFGISRPRPLDL